eukprot:GEMP01009567.1.p1 GENE.GEMP01009567.1~~GEMP01009567.1.p1  ORF type:complete len:704 (+),score=164.59 GEMP01009567.1:30-2141(+)
MHPEYLPDNQRTPSASSAKSASSPVAGYDNFADPPEVSPMLPSAEGDGNLPGPPEVSFPSQASSSSTHPHDGDAEFFDLAEPEPATALTEGDGTDQNDVGEAEPGEGQSPPSVDSKVECGEELTAEPIVSTCPPLIDRPEDFVDFVDVSAEPIADTSAVLIESDSNIIDFSGVESGVDLPTDGSTDFVDVSAKHKVETSATFLESDSNIINFSVAEPGVETSTTFPTGGDTDIVDFSTEPMDASGIFLESDGDMIDFSVPEPGVEASATLATDGDADFVEFPTESLADTSATLPRRDDNIIDFSATEPGAQTSRPSTDFPGFTATESGHAIGEFAVTEPEAQTSQLFAAGDANFDAGDADFDEGDADFYVGDVDFDEGDADFDDGDADFGDFPEKQRVTQRLQLLAEGDTDLGDAGFSDFPSTPPATPAPPPILEDDSNDNFSNLAEAAPSVTAFAAPRSSGGEDAVAVSVPVTATPVVDVVAEAAAGHAAPIPSPSPAADDDDGFGDFAEAAPQPATIHASATPISDDDDFGDFEEAKNFEDGAFNKPADSPAWEAEIEHFLAAWHRGANIPPLLARPTKSLSAESVSSSCSLPSLGVPAEARTIISKGVEPNAEIIPVVHQEALGTPFVWSQSAIRAAYADEVSTFIEALEFQECDEHRGDAGPGLAALSPEARRSTSTSQKALQTLPDLSLLLLSHVRQR